MLSSKVTIFGIFFRLFLATNPCFYTRSRWSIKTYSPYSRGIRTSKPGSVIQAIRILLFGHTLSQLFCLIVTLFED